MKHRERIGAALLLVLCICVIVWGVVTLRERTEPKDDTIPGKIVQLYSKKQDITDKEICALIDRLRSSSPKEADQWERILKFWHDANQEGAVHYTLPADDLNNDESLCIVVLGYQLNPDGSMKDELVGRLETALSFRKQYPEAFILCTGGGTAAGNPQATEADAMAAWLAERKVPSEKIIIENRSMTTTENAIFSCEILREKYSGVEQLYIVSSDYHIPWGSVLFQTKCIMMDSFLSVRGNLAYKAPNPMQYPLVQYQAAGILKIAG